VDLLADHGGWEHWGLGSSGSDRQLSSPQAHGRHTDVGQDLPSQVRRGVSYSADPQTAARELQAAIYDPDAALTLFFCSNRYDRELLGRELRARFPSGILVGCTTAGEITPLGHSDGSIVGVSFSSRAFKAVSVRVDDLGNFELGRGDQLAAEVLSGMMKASGKLTRPNGATCFGFLVCDGLSMQEELLVSSIYRNLGDIQLFGGSAGDGTRFKATFIYHDGEFRTNCAVFTLIETSLPFRIFKTEHFEASHEKMVVTEADVMHRIVTEINGEPAGREYARIVGLDVHKLTPMIFACYPVVVRVGGLLYVRSIQQVNDDESLTFFCAIDRGIVLTVARGNDMVDNLARAFDRVRQEIGAPSLVLGCDCVLRYLEVQQVGIRDSIGALMSANNVVGFATYGEQFNGMHVNQTFTGVAIGGGAA
jgi:hypothetical protein